MELAPYKFVINAIAQELDADGNVVGEVPLDPVVVFGCERLTQWAKDFPAKLADAAKEQTPAP